MKIKMMTMLMGLNVFGVKGAQMGVVMVPKSLTVMRNNFEKIGLPEFDKVTNIAALVHQQWRYASHDSLIKRVTGLMSEAAKKYDQQMPDDSEKVKKFLSNGALYCCIWMRANSATVFCD